MAILELSLETGRKIWASTIHMESTYAGLLEGYPNAAMNDRLIAGLARRAVELFGDWPVQVIEPSRTTRERTHPTPFGPAEYLPSYWVAAEFNSVPLSDTMHASQLIVVWFQEHPFPVPSEALLGRLKAMAWDNVARDFEY